MIFFTIFFRLLHDFAILCAKCKKAIPYKKLHYLRPKFEKTQKTQKNKNRQRTMQEVNDKGLIGVGEGR